VRNILLDTGPLVALFSPRDEHHAHYQRLMVDMAELRLITTWPCLVESSYLLTFKHRLAMFEFVRRGGVAVYPFGAEHLGDMLSWMRTYTEPDKIEMDFADASLYWLAVDTGITEIMTTDRRDFERYRLPDGRSFQIA
jgi:predicted nucleic acid-binding protein